MRVLDYCWACDEPLFYREPCECCGAPWWPISAECGTGGVYIVAASCGLWKIGVSQDVAARARILGNRSAGNVELLAVLRGAGYDVEHWLHKRFPDTRDTKTAALEGLVAPTEWFWPTPSIRRLAQAEPFIVDGQLWEDAAHEGDLAWLG